MPHGRKKFQARSRRFRRFRAKRRQQLLSVKTVERISKKSAEAVLSKEAETLRVYDPIAAGLAYPNTQTAFGLSDNLLHRGGLTDLQGNQLRTWGPQVKLENQYAAANAQGDGFRTGDKISLKGISVKGFIHINPATLPIIPEIEFWLLSHAPIRPAGAPLADRLVDIRVEKTNWALQRNLNVGKVYKTEFRKTFRIPKDASLVTVPFNIPVDFYIPINRTFRYQAGGLPATPLNITDLMSRPLLPFWRALGIPEGGAPMARANYPQLNVAYNWYYTDI